MNMIEAMRFQLNASEKMKISDQAFELEVSKDKIESLEKLIKGKFPEELANIFTAQKEGLFPTPEESSFEYSCPDYASMCKHNAAVLYGVGSRLDENPSLFFTLRDVNIDELISKAVSQKSETLLKKSDKKSSRVIDKDDISSMFDIDLNTED